MKQKKKYELMAANFREIIRAVNLELFCKIITCKWKLKSRSRDLDKNNIDMQPI